LRIDYFQPCLRKMDLNSPHPAPAVEFHPRKEMDEFDREWREGLQAGTDADFLLKG
jgi:hypothetical protein